MSNKNEMLKLGFILFLITFIVALALGGVNAMTKDVILAVEKQTLDNSLKEIFDSAKEFEEVEVSDAQKESGVKKIYIAKDGEQMLGVAVNVAPNGFGGAIDMMVGVDIEGKTKKVKILSLAETPGLGTKLDTDKFKDQYEGKAAPFDVIKSGVPKDSEILAITAATISSKAATEGVNQSAEVAAEVLAKGGEK